jgi:hypothetical protein
MKVITGSDLRTGDVIWWTGEGWSRHVNDAVDAGEHAEAIIARENAKQIVTDTQVIEATQTPEGVAPRTSRTASARSARRCASTSPSSPPTLPPATG